MVSKERLKELEEIIRAKYQEGKETAVIEKEMWEEHEVPWKGFDSITSRMPEFENDWYEYRMNSVAQKVLVEGFSDAIISKEFNIPQVVDKALEEKSITPYEAKFAIESANEIAKIIKEEFEKSDKLYKEHLDEAGIAYEENELNSGVSVVVSNDGYIMNTNKAITKAADIKEFEQKFVDDTTPMSLQNVGTGRSGEEKENNKKKVEPDFN